MNIFKSMTAAIQKSFFNFDEFYKAIADNDKEKFEWCLKNRIDSRNINHFNSNRYNALSYICKYNRVDFLDKILPLKPSTNIKDHNGKTPLFKLCEKADSRDDFFGYRDLMFGDKLKANDTHDKIELIQKLLDYGVHVDTMDYNKTTPLIKAVTNKFEDVSILLLKYGADPTWIDKDGKCALGIALSKWHHKENILQAMFDTTDIPRLARMEKILEEYQDKATPHMVDTIKSLQIKTSLDMKLGDKPKNSEKKMKI